MTKRKYSMAMRLKCRPCDFNNIKEKSLEKNNVSFLYVCIEQLFISQASKCCHD